MNSYHVIAATTENTVVTSYEPTTTRSDSYQSEAALEQAFIQQLTQQGYTYLPIHTEAELIANLRRQLEALNHYNFTDSEWDRFFHEALANPNEHIVEKTRKVQEDFVQVLRRDDGTSKNITLLDKKNIHNNRLQVINQYTRQPGPGRPPRQPLRRDHPGQRPAPGPCGTQAPGRGHPGSLQPDRPLPAGLLLVGLRPV